MTRCHCGLLCLQCSGLAPPTPCQSPGARAFSPAEALERLRARLLDLTRQNRLLHFRHPKGRSLQFVNVDIEAAFRRLANGDNCALLWVPESHRTDYAPGPRPEARQWAMDYHKWDINIELAPPRGNLPAAPKSGRALHAVFYPPDLDRLTRAIARDAKTDIEETGVNVLHPIFGFVPSDQAPDLARGRGTPRNAGLKPFTRKTS